MGFSLNYGVRVGAAKYSLRFFYFLTYIRDIIIIIFVVCSKFQNSKNSAANGLSDHNLQFNLTSRPFVVVYELCTYITTQIRVVDSFDKQNPPPVRLGFSHILCMHESDSFLDKFKITPISIFQFADFFYLGNLPPITEFVCSIHLTVSVNLVVF